MNKKPVVPAATLAALAAALALPLQAAQAAVVWNEAVSGDLSGSGAAPTFVALALGSNQVIGTTGNGGTGTDRDYFTITVPALTLLTSFNVLSGTVPLGLAFIGVQAGSAVTVSPTAGSPAGLAGWTHYASTDIGTNILPRMGTGAGANGFAGPLGPGSYSFWIQDFNAGSSTYAFEITLAAVPEPAPAAMLAAGVLALACVRRARRPG